MEISKGNPFPFGAKSIEELEARDAGKNQTTEIKEEVKTEPVVENKETPTDPLKETKETVTKEEPKSKSWLEEVNGLYKTEFKTPDEFRSVFEKAKKAEEYEPKVKGWEETEKQYKEQLNQLQRSLNPLEHFSSPEAYVAEQLKKQRPDLNPKILQDVVLEDNKRMSDIDVLVKNALLTTPGLKGGEQGVKETILSDLNIDPSLPEEEWSVTAQNKIMMRANQARKEWDELKTKVQVPKVQTTEERMAESARLQAERSAKLIPIKETFTKFDKFTEHIDGKLFEFNVPEEHQKEVGAMFDSFFLEAGLEPTKENLQYFMDIVKGTMLLNYFPKVHKTIEANTETRMRAEQDKLLNNTNPSNTKTATEHNETDAQKFSREHGFGKLFGKK